jgi:hypothetical protein
VLNYRLYFLRDGYITHYVQIDCASDEDALKAAEKHGLGVIMELWQGARLVKRFTQVDEA